jgi:outer membrane lipoprotein carrier protein
MKKYIIFILTMSITMGLYAQKDKKATKILEELSKKTESYKTIEVDFLYKMDNNESDIHESYDGELLVEGDKYRLNIAGQLVISDGETIWTYIEDAEEVQINSIEEGEEVFTPTNFLDSYTENYKSKLIGEENRDGKNVQIIELIPFKKKNYSKVELILDKDKNQMISFSIFDNNNSIYTYLITKFIPDVPLNGNEFVFNPEDYPDVEIIDMR